MGALVYLRDIHIDHINSIQHRNLREGVITITLSCIGDSKDLVGFTEFTRGKLIPILQNYTMDWHVKEDPERIEFILDTMGRITEFQSSGKIAEAKALLKLVEIVLPEYMDSPQYQTVEEMRNIIYDNLYLDGKK